MKFLLFIILFLSFNIFSKDLASANVVVVVDTSISMKEFGMDPERTSLLVSKLLADIVPGNLAVIRLLDLVKDENLLPSKIIKGKCPENDDRPFSDNCTLVEPIGNWETMAKTNQYGLLKRPVRGDEDYKKELEYHLRQISNNSGFYLAFNAAEGFFADITNQDPKVLIWLSDGRPDNNEKLEIITKKLLDKNIYIQAVVFGKGDVSVAKYLGLPVTQTTNPSELMQVFSNAFRKIVQAPFRIDNKVHEKADFIMQPNVSEAWVVVYGDKTLQAVKLKTPKDTIIADYAADTWPQAGAYKVAYIQNPIPGAWQVLVEGGGLDVAYAVIQRSDLQPILLSSNMAILGAKTPVEIGIKSGLEGELITDKEILNDITLSLEIEGKEYYLNYKGESRFSTEVIFEQAKAYFATIHLKSAIIDKKIIEKFTVDGKFSYQGSPIHIDFNQLSEDQTVCKFLDLSKAEFQGQLPFILKKSTNLPPEHTIYLKVKENTLYPNKSFLSISDQDNIEICLHTSKTAPSSQAEKKHYINFQLQNTDNQKQSIQLLFSWEVKGLSFLQRWLWLILIIIGIIFLIFIILGFILPKKFPAALALVFVPEYEDLDEQSPQPIKQWKGVGIGFYKNARAYLQSNYRVSGSKQNAVARLAVEDTGVSVFGISALYFETMNGDWELVPQQGRKIRSGDIYRVDTQGPYFRVSMRHGG